jgi:sarcosine oxidase/L-pipecolate oxidase
MSGLLNFGNPNYGAGGPEGTLLDPITNLKAKNLPFKHYLTGSEIMKDYPCFKNLPESYQAVFSPDNGSINVPLVLRTLARLAETNGAQLVQHAHVKNLAVDTKGVTVSVDLGAEGPKTVKGKKAIITSGAYSNDIL